MKNLTDALTYTAAVRVVEDGDDVDGVNSEATAQDLANRTAYLKNQVELSGTKFKVLNVIEGVASFGVADIGLLLLPGSGVRLVSFGTTAASKSWYQPIRLPHGVTLSQISATVQQGNAGSSGRMSMKVWRWSANGSGGTLLQLGATVQFTAGAGYQTGFVSGLTEVIDAEREYFVEIIASSLTATNSDGFVHGFATYTDPRANLNRG